MRSGGNNRRNCYGLERQRLFAALAASCERFLAVSVAARAWPPLRPPSRPRATAAGFLGRSGSSWSFGAWPVDSRTIWKAIWLKSPCRGFMEGSIAQGHEKSDG